MKLADKFELSRGRALDDIEQELQGLRAELAGLKAGAVGAATPPPVASSWRYDATEFPFFSENVYALEVAGDQMKRWVGPEPRLSLDLRLRRDLRYRAEVRVVDIAVPGGEGGFQAVVDGELVPHKFQAGVAIFDIQDNLAAFRRGAGLNAALVMDEPFVRRPSDADEDRRILSFSISSVRISRLDD
ncbi:MAG: hypothetical protein AAFR11_11000 [Pseudomonadota bacterium]